MIIELFGLPGCGKTTFLKSVLNQVDSSSITILGTDNFLEKSTRKDVVLGILSWQGLSFIFRAFILLCRYNLLFNKKVIINFLRIPGYFRFYSSEMNRNNRVIIMDEAIVQSVVTALFNHCVIKQKEFENLISSCIKHFNIKLYYLWCSVEQANENISKRANPSHGRCDRIKDMNLRNEILYTELCNFNLLKDSSLPVEVISNEDERKMQIASIKQMIGK